MLGTKLRRRRDRREFRVIGCNGRGHWVLGTEPFGPAITASDLEISALFTPTGAAPERTPTEAVMNVAGRTGDEQAGYEALSDQAYERFAASLGKPIRSDAPTPEEAFRDESS